MPIFRGGRLLVLLTSGHYRRRGAGAWEARGTSNRFRCGCRCGGRPTCVIAVEVRFVLSNELAGESGITRLVAIEELVIAFEARAKCAVDVREARLGELTDLGLDLRLKLTADHVADLLPVVLMLI